jgi:DNA repair exonuclease SbcCD ATPase subunit
LGKVESLHIVKAPAEPALSARTELAELIALAREGKQVEAEARETLRKAKARVLECTRNLEQVRASIASTKEALSAKYASGTMPPTADGSLREARAAELEALDNLDIFQGALASLEENVAQAERASRLLNVKIVEAVNAVLEPELLAQIAKTKAAENEYTSHLAVLKFLAEKLGNKFGPDKPVVQEAYRVLNVSHIPVIWDHHPADTAWREASDRLLTDPNTPLPE